MADHLTLARGLQLTLFLSSLLALHNFARTNGLFDHMAAFSGADAVLPNTTIPVRQFRTGLQPVDDYMSFMISLFWIDLDSRNVRAHTQGLHFYGMLSSAWLLMVVEAHRAGNSTWFMLQTYVVEFVGELAGVGMTTPLWCLYHLSTSTTVSPRRSVDHVDGFFISSADATVLPIALALGFGVPTFAMFLGDPAGDLLSSSQTWSLLRLAHPLFVFVIWRLLRFVVRTKETQTTWNAASTLRHFYTWVTLSSATCHLLALGPLMMRVLSPTWLRPEVVVELEPLTLFVPVPFWDSPAKRVASFAEGVSTFLVWDESLTTTAMIVWGFTLYYNGTKRVPSSMARSSISVLLQACVYGLAAGPGAAVAFFVQERDNVVFNMAQLASRKTR